MIKKLYIAHAYQYWRRYPNKVEVLSVDTATQNCVPEQRWSIHDGMISKVELYDTRSMSFKESKRNALLGKEVDEIADMMVNYYTIVNDSLSSKPYPKGYAIVSFAEEKGVFTWTAQHFLFETELVKDFLDEGSKKRPATLFIKQKTPPKSRQVTKFVVDTNTQTVQIHKGKQVFEIRTAKGDLFFALWKKFIGTATFAVFDESCDLVQDLLAKEKKWNYIFDMRDEFTIQFKSKEYTSATYWYDRSHSVYKQKGCPRIEPNASMQLFFKDSFATETEYVDLNGQKIWNCFPVQQISEIANIAFLITNPGIESIYKSVYKKQLQEQRYFKMGADFEATQEAKETQLYTILKLSSSESKAINYTLKKIEDTLSTLTNSQFKMGILCEEVSSQIFNQKAIFCSVLNRVKGLNNFKTLIDAYFQQYFCDDYLAHLMELQTQYAQSRNGGWGGLPYYIRSRIVSVPEEDRMQFLANEALKESCVEFIDSLQIVEKILKIAPSYINNIEGFSFYFTQLPRRQGFSNCKTALTMLKDYISQQENMNCRWEKYPKSLHMAHDMASKNYSIYEKRSFMTQTSDAFEKSVETYKDLEYAPLNKPFSVVCPHTFLDLFVEGASLNHCVASYIPKVSSQESKILFIRKTKEIETPFFTVEISQDNKIHQVKGMSQKDPDTKELINFISEWAAKKHLQERYL